MKLRASEELTKGLVRAHTYLQSHKDDPKDKFIQIIDGAKTLKRETNWGLELLYRTGKDGETGIKDGETYMQIAIKPTLFHSWWKGIGTISYTFHASIYGLLLTYYPPHPDKPGILALSMDRKDYIIEDRLYSAIGITPCKALLNDLRICQPAPVLGNSKNLKFVNKFIVSKLIIGTDGGDEGNGGALKILRLK